VQIEAIKDASFTEGVPAFGYMAFIETFAANDAFIHGKQCIRLDFDIIEIIIVFHAGKFYYK
jgi:hypothetical protein